MRNIFPCVLCRFERFGSRFWVAKKSVYCTANTTIISIKKNGHRDRGAVDGFLSPRIALPSYYSQPDIPMSTSYTRSRREPIPMLSCSWMQLLDHWSYNQVDHVAVFHRWMCWWPLLPYSRPMLTSTICVRWHHYLLYSIRVADQNNISDTPIVRPEWMWHWSTMPPHDHAEHLTESMLRTFVKQLTIDYNE